MIHNFSLKLCLAIFWHCIDHTLIWRINNFWGYCELTTFSISKYNCLKCFFTLGGINFTIINRSGNIVFLVFTIYWFRRAFIMQYNTSYLWAINLQLRQFKRWGNVLEGINAAACWLFNWEKWILHRQPTPLQLP